MSQGRRCVAWAFALLLAAGVPPVQGVLDEGAAWVKGPVRDGLPALGKDGGLHFRVRLDARLSNEAAAGMQNLPASVVLELDEILAQQAGYPSDAETGLLRGFQLDLDSFALVEVDGDDALLRDKVPLRVLRGGEVDLGDFDVAENPTVTVQWVLPGPTASGQIRHFHLYFDVLHNGDKPPEGGHDPVDLERLAAAAGPGPGTRLYVPLFPLLGAQGAGERRTVLITSVSGRANVDVFEYDVFGVPDARPAQSFVLPGRGSSALYVLGKGGTEASSGLVLVASDAPVVAQGRSLIAPNVPASGQFLPSDDGGYLGSRFTSFPHRAESWAVYCPATTERLEREEEECAVRLAGQDHAIGLNGQVLVNVPALQAAQLTADGDVAVQRLGPGFSSWPSLDGPRRGSLFIGQADPADRLHVFARDAASKVRVQSLAGAAPVLHPQLAVPPTQSLRWNQNWPTTNAHAGGPAALTVLSGAGGVGVQSGGLDPSNPNALSFLTPLQSPDGGLTHHAFIPSDNAGNPIGQLVVFTPHAGTVLTVRRAGATQTPIVTDKDQALTFSGAGEWKLTANRPFLVAWLNVGTSPFTGYAPAITDRTVQVEVAGAQFAGHAFDLAVAEDLVIAQPGDELFIEVQLRNFARTVVGQPVADKVRLSLSAPQGWSKLVPSDPVRLDPQGGDAGQNATVLRVTVPKGVGVGSGADLVVEGQSEGNPALRVQQVVRVRFEAERRVVVTADGQDVQAKKAVRGGETASYLLEVLNAGTVRDTYTIECSPLAAGWEAAFTLDLCPAQPLEVTLEPGASIQSVLDLRPVSDSVSQSKLVFSASSHSDQTKRDTVSVVTTLDVERSFRFLVPDPTRVVRPGATTTFNLTIVNEADVNEDLAVTMDRVHPAGWSDASVEWVGVGPLEAAGGSVRLAPRDTALLRIVQTVPAGAPPLATALNRLHVQSRFTAEKAPVDVDLRTLAARVADVAAAASPSPAPAVPGEPLRLVLQLDLSGNVNQTVSVTVLPSHGAWDLRDGAGRPAPWTVALVPGVRGLLEVQARVPNDLPPDATPPAHLVFVLASAGHAPLQVPVDLVVAERRAIVVEAEPLALARGLGNPVPVPVRNDGNVPLRLVASWTGLPPGWQAAPVQLDLPRAAAAVLNFTLHAPAAGEVVPAPPTLEVRTASGELLQAVQVPVRLGTPALQGSLVEVRPLPGGDAVYAVEVHNSGDATAHQVEVRLARGGEVLDRLVLLQVRPGSTQVANLVGPGESADLELRLAAAHDPAGVLLALTPDGGSKGTPAPSPALALLLVLLAAVARRARWPQ